MKRSFLLQIIHPILFRASGIKVFQGCTVGRRGDFLTVIGDIACGYVGLSLFSQRWNASARTRDVSIEDVLPISFRMLASGYKIL